MRLTRFTRKFAIIIAGIFALGAILIAWSWHQGKLQPWLQAKVVAFYLSKVEPALPFKVEQAEVDARWADFREGKLTRLALVILWEEYRIRLSGPIELERESGVVSIQYLPAGTIEPAGKPEGRSTELGLSLAARLSQGLSKVDELTLLLQAKTFAWKHLGIESRNLSFVADWRDERAEAELTAGELSWTSPEVPDHAFQIQGLKSGLQAPMKINPLVIGPQSELSLQISNAEVLWGETYLDLPIAGLPLKGTLRNEPGQDLSTLRSAHLALGFPKKATFELKVEDTALELNWITSALSIPQLTDFATKAVASSGGPLAQLGKLTEFRLRRGSLTTEGEARFPWSAGSIPEIRPEIRMDLKLANVDLDWPASKLALRGTQARIPYSTATGSDGQISIASIRYRKSRGKLDSTSFKFRPGGAGALHLGNGPLLPLSFEGVPLTISAITGNAGAGGFSLNSAARLDPVELKSVAATFCADSNLIPPGTLSAAFEKITIRPESIEPTGAISLKAFEGELRVDGIGFFDYVTESPQLNFNANLTGMKLDPLGQWLGFGKMEGTLEAFARDAVIQGSIPLQYDFRLEAKPLEGEKKVVLSARAMKNIVRLVGGADVDEIPGIANTIAFGWVSRLFGGYNVEYAGISLFSRDGSILLETLDPPHVLEKERTRFILYGPRFKMPLQTKSYPVVLDATQMGSYGRYLGNVLKDISDQAETETRKNGNVQQDEDHDCDPTTRP